MSETASSGYSQDLELRARYSSGFYPGSDTYFSLLQLIGGSGADLEALQGAFFLHTDSQLNADIWYRIA